MILPKGGAHLMTNEEYGKIVAKNLKRLAYQTGKTQVEIAKELGINNATLSAWMNGTRIPKMDKIDMLANYFNVTRNEIMMPYGMVPLESFTAFERNIIMAYRNASQERKDSVLLLLGLKE
jgi:transcriptional regulator with XRE-family HTH domain